MTDGAAAPIDPVSEPRPRVAGAAGLLAFAGSAAGLVGLVATGADWTQLRARLEAVAKAANPTASAELIGTSVRTTVLVVVGGVAVLSVVTLLWTALVLRRKRWARWLLVSTGLLTAALAAVAQAVVAGGVDVDRLAFLTQAGLVVISSVLVCAPATGSWLRGD